MAFLQKFQRTLLVQDDIVELVAETSPQEQPQPQSAAEPIQPQAAAANGHLAAMEEQFECAVCKDWLVAPFSVHPCGHLLCGEHSSLIM